MKRMFHPEHGFHHCYSPAEEEVMIQNGWQEEKAPQLEQSQTLQTPEREKIRGNRRGVK